MQLLLLLDVTCVVVVFAQQPSIKKLDKGRLVHIAHKVSLAKQLSERPHKSNGMLKNWYRHPSLTASLLTI